MSEPVWMKFVQWPTCSECKSSGVRIDPVTKWPEECQRCAAGRKRAVKAARSTRRRGMKAGGVG